MKQIQSSIDKVRYESFGGIISCSNPPFLAWVDREYMRKIGYGASALWAAVNEKTGCLSAPAEVHFAVTNRCRLGCEGCYMSAEESGAEDMSTDDAKKSLKKLADMGVFHLALGGGEAFERDDFGEIVQYCRTVAMQGTGDFSAPDHECPVVVDYNKNKSSL